MSRERKRTSLIQIRVSPTLKEEAFKMAKKKDITLTRYIEGLITVDIEATKYRENPYTIYKTDGKISLNYD
jgi:hypothetical protein